MNDDQTPVTAQPVQQHALHPDNPVPSTTVPASQIAPAPVDPNRVTKENWNSTRETDYQLLEKIHNVAFFGFADAKPETQLYKDAFETAKLLAEKGFTIVDGGGPGVMAAATKGAQAVQGETLAVTFYPKDAPGFEGRYVGNVAGKEIVTRNYIERMFKLMEHGDVYVIFNGGTGTISEFGTAWVLARLYFGHHKPFILFGAFWHEIIDAIQKNMMMRGNETEVLKIVTTPQETLDAIMAFDKQLVELSVQSHVEEEEIQEQIPDEAQEKPHV